MIDNILINLSNNKLFCGCLMLLTNLGGKYLALELPTNIEKLFTTNFILRYLVLFSIFFMATRDVKTSLLLSLLFFIILKYFINEKSTFCLIKNDEINLKKEITNNKISIEEYLKAKEILNRYYQESKENNMRIIY
jgi:hypothetical protein